MIEVGFLCLGGVELISDARVLSYLANGLAGASMVPAIGTVGSGTHTYWADEFHDAYCLHPRELVLTADLQWVPCGSIREGDEVLAFDEHPQPGNRVRRFQRAVVTRSEPAVKESVLVRLDNGDEVICSADHPWLAYPRSDNHPRWVPAADLADMTVVRQFTMWEADDSYEAGWLAGMFDGEGYLTIGKTARLGMAQKPGPVMDRMFELMERFKFTVTRTVNMHPNGSVDHMHVGGNFAESLRALGTLRPMRLLEKFRTAPVEQRSIRQYKNGATTVLGVEPLGPSPVQSIATSTRTYFGAGYAMHNSDIYGTEHTVDCADGFAPVCLECACPALTAGDAYVDPATDDAPWYQASVARSAEFLGVLSSTIDFPTPHVRLHVPRGRFGGTPAPEQLGPRIVQITAQLFAATSGGLEWGIRWLQDVVAGACGDPADMTILPFCPDDQFGLDAAYRVLPDCILVDGPHFTPAGLFHGFRVMNVAWQMSSASPWLTGLPQLCASRRLAPGATVSCLIETDDWGGGQAVLLQASGGIDGLNVRAVPLAADQDCTDALTGMAAAEFTVTGTKPGDTLTVDASRRSALLTDVSSKLDVSAIAYLDFDGPFRWIDAPPCTRLCVTVTNNGAGIVDVSLSTVLREL